MAATEAETTAMRRALELALRGPRGLNPQVGAVILSPTGEVIAEGWHRGAGTAHAEVDALSQLSTGEARGATAVVTLEPCNHTGRTGPCAIALLEAGIARVVYSVDDPAEISGGGAERLRENGVDVVGGVCAEQGRALIAEWMDLVRRGRPHVTVKWAQSLDGRAAAADGTSRWITGPVARTDVHARRAHADAIVVGTGTALADDPALTARDEDGSLLASQPEPIVVGYRPLPRNARLREHPRGLVEYRSHDLAALLDLLRARGDQRVFVEGGPRLASAFLAADLVDELLVYIAPTLLGSGADGADRPALGDIGVPTIARQRRLRITAVDRLGDDLLLIAHPLSPGTPPPAPSLDAPGGR